MTSKPRNIPSSESPLASPPKLEPKVKPLRIGDGHGEDEDQEEKPAKRAPRPGRSRGGRRPPPAVEDAVVTTVRFDPEESSEVDWFVLELRDDSERRGLDKAEVFRELIRLAREHEPTRRALIRRLK